MVKRVPRPVRSTQRMNAYRMAMIDPFDSMAHGVRLPNDFAVPTQTKTVSGFMTLGCRNNVKSSFLFTPSPILSMYNPHTTLAQTDMIPYTNWSAVYQSIDASILRSSFSSWRMVAGGIRIKSLLPSTATPLICSVATAPVVGSGPGPNFLNTGPPITTLGIVNVMSDIVGSAPSTVGGWGTNLSNSPNYNRFTTQDVTTQSITIPFRVSDSRAFDFKNSLSAVGSGYSVGYQVAEQVVIDTTSGAIVRPMSTDNEENYAFEGFNAILLDIGSAVASLGTVLEIEYIYHLEGVQAGNNSSSLNAITGAVSQPDSSSHLLDIAWANRQGLYKIASAMTGTLFNKVDPNLIANILGLRL